MRLGTSPPLSTGRGRQTGAPKRVREVETLPCPERDGNHWLIWRRGKLACCGCAVDWPTLDAQVRAG